MEACLREDKNCMSCQSADAHNNWTISECYLLGTSSQLCMKCCHSNTRERSKLPAQHGLWWASWRKFAAVGDQWLVGIFILVSLPNLGEWVRPHFWVPGACGAKVDWGLKTWPVIRKTDVIDQAVKGSSLIKKCQQKGKRQ